jgi:hypothetical protein
MNIINIRPFCPQDEKSLTEAASADGHSVICPSFVFEKNNEIVGYYSVTVPMVLSWQDSKKMTALDSVKELGHIEGTLAQFPIVCIPCDPDSPYMRFLPKQGYETYFKPVTLFTKRK